MTISLSRRLETIASYLPQSARFADIGTDHAYLPCYVCLKDPSARAIASEVNRGPYERALATVKSHQLENHIDVRLGNGLKTIDPSKDRIEQVVIAGMGGPLMRDILEAGKEELRGVKRLILQANIASKPLREWLFANEFSITHEKIIEEKEHLYEIIVADHQGEKVFSDCELAREKEMYFGPLLLKERDPLFYQKWSAQLEHLQKITEDMKSANAPKDRLASFLQEIEWIKEVLSND